MAAPKGNEYWKLVQKRTGTPLYFDSPLELLEAAENYFEWCENNPILEEDYRGKDATRVEVKKMRPFTLQGLCIHIGLNTFYFNDLEKRIKARMEGEKPTDDDKEFTQILKYIRDKIYNQKFSGAAAGQLNANIIARDLGLADKTQVGGDPDNPLTPLQQIVVFQLPDNSRNSGLIE